MCWRRAIRPNALDTTVEERRLGLARAHEARGSRERRWAASRIAPCRDPRRRACASESTPRSTPAAPLMAGLVYFHGGGLVAGTVETHDGIARALAQLRAPAGWCRSNTGWPPNTPFPPRSTMPWRPSRYIGAHAADFGIDAARLGICGDSAGGTLAAATAPGGGPNRQPAPGPATADLSDSRLQPHHRHRGAISRAAIWSIRPRSITIFCTTCRRAPILPIRGSRRCAPTTWPACRAP